MGKGRRGIPERWQEYSNMGRRIPGTKFIPFKVPLKVAYLHNLDEAIDFFDPRSVMDHCSSLGMVIDLTNTERYYNPEVFSSNNIVYYKLKTFGHIIPTQSDVFKFFEAVDDFLEKNSSNDRLIGVHCTHGVNRTGYMICRYMIQQLGVPPDEAIGAFNSARGHELERENYLEDLRKASWPAFKLDSLKLENQTETEITFSRKRVRDQFSDDEDEEAPPYFPHKPKYDSSLPSSSFHGDTPPLTRRRKMLEENYPNDLFSKTDSYLSHEDEPYFNDFKVSKVPAVSKAYYEMYFGYEGRPMYESDFYRRRGGGIGPHRPPPRTLPIVRNDGKTPRQYVGPRPYRAISPSRTYDIDSFDGSSKRPLLQSPDSGERPQLLRPSDAKQKLPLLKSPDSEEALSQGSSLIRSSESYRSPQLLRSPGFDGRPPLLQSPYSGARCPLLPSPDLDLRGKQPLLRTPISSEELPLLKSPDYGRWPPLLKSPPVGNDKFSYCARRSFSSPFPMGTPPLFVSPDDDWKQRSWRFQPY